MKKSIPAGLALSFLLVLLPVCAFSEVLKLPQTGQTDCWDDWNTLIQCPNTGQDGEHQAGIPWPKPRFNDNGDGTMTDNLTGLTWLKDANCMATHYPGADKDLSAQASWETAGDGAVSWQHALDFVASINSGAYPKCGGGKTGWRLPHVNEMDSLVNLFIGTAIPTPTTLSWLTGEGFKNIQTRLYWLSTTHAENPLTGWDIDMEFGWVVLDAKIWNHFVWPVRGGADGAVDPNYPANVWKTGQTTKYANGDDGDLEHGVAWPKKRFFDNTDATITDLLTGRVWLKDANCMGTQYPGVDLDTNSSSPGDGTVTWEHALEFIAGTNNGTYPKCASGYNDWRLPNRKELHSLTDYSRFNPAVPAGHPFSNVKLLSYWTSSNFGDTREAWTIDMGHGRVLKDFKSEENWVWPVRGGCTVGSVMAAPSGQQPFGPLKTVSPMWSSDPAKAKPLAVGPSAVGGIILNLIVEVCGFSKPVDLYVVIYAPALHPDYFLVKPDLSLQSHKKGVVPWRANTKGHIREAFFVQVPVAGLPPGLYTFALAAAASGGLSDYYLWWTSLTLP